MRNYYFFLFIALITGIIIGNTISNIEYNDFDTNFSSSQIDLVAVNSEGNGITIPLEVDVKKGNGLVLTNIDKLLFWVDTQFSIQTARNIAENVTGIDTSKLDLIYIIKSNETGIIGGPSAGAALTIATIGALENKTMKKGILITGTINPDGTIGKVGGILEKAKAAKQAGAQLFLVPLGQGIETKLEPIKTCKTAGQITYCQLKYKKQMINIGENADIAVLEVKNIYDALKYFY
ncbi:MAG: hypothetical protein J7K26_00530 [Candidatus Aenigmarchaeota archaeon]|nr:hypothetical protein [Candidatus Aenigmarchaeota archaeon]